MKKLFTAALFMLPLFTMAANDTLKFWIQLKDKKESPYSIKRPEEFLSQKAIERRKKFDIPVTEQDFPVNPNYIKQVGETGVKVLNTSRWLNGISVQTADNDMIKKIAALPFVKGVEVIGVYSNKDGSKMDYLMEFLMSMGGEDEEKEKTPEGGGINPETNPELYYGKGYNQIKMLDGVAMHNMGFTGKGVTIAILDGGFMNVDKIKTFKHLYKNKQLMGTWDFVELDSNVYDDNNHGMNVLSCIASKTPSKMVGTAPDAMFWLLRTEDANTEYVIEEYNWASGAEFADSAGVDVINSSLGYSTFDDETMNHTYKQLDGKTSVATRAATIAAQKGILICNAAGNEGNDPWKFIGAPADAEGIITVGGVNSDSTYADFSSYGPTSDGRIKPTLSAQATQAFVASVADAFYASQGTSFASPILCGMVACLRQANPDKSVTDIIDALQLSATQFAHPDTILGYGIPNLLLANRYLGADKTFDYKKDNVAAAPTTVFKNNVSWVVHLTKKQKVEAKLTEKSIGTHSAKDIHLTLDKGFHAMTFAGLDGLKPGDYLLEITIGKQVSQYHLTKK